MQQFCTYGSVRGAPGNRRPYRDKTGFLGKIPSRRPPISTSGQGSLINPERFAARSALVWLMAISPVRGTRFFRPFLALGAIRPPPPRGFASEPDCKPPPQR